VGGVGWGVGGWGGRTKVKKPAQQNVPVRKRAGLAGMPLRGGPVAKPVRGRSPGQRAALLGWKWAARWRSLCADEARAES
jgi:hypothetical protein